MAIDWNYVGENSFEGIAAEEANKDREAESKYNTGVSVILGRHLERQANRAAEINAVPAPEVPKTFQPGTGESVALEQPLPPRNPAPGGLVPLSVPGAVTLRGYVDQDGNVTPAGKQFYHLMKEGMFDEDGLPTAKAKAFTMSPEDALLPQNLDAFTEREKAYLNDEPSTSWGDKLSGIVGGLGDIVKGTHTLLKKAELDRIYNPASLLRWGDESPEDQAKAFITAESAGKGALETSAVSFSGAKTIAEKGLAMLQGDERAFYAAAQQHAAFKDDLRNIEAAQLLGNIVDSHAILGHVTGNDAAAKAILGPEKTAEAQRQGEAAGAFWGDPVNLATAGVGMMAGTASKAPALFRMQATVDRALLARTAAAELATDATAAKAALTRTGTAAQIAAQKAEDLRGIGQIERSQRLAATAERLALKADEAAKAIPLLEEKAAGQATLAEKLTQKAGGAEQILEMIDNARKLKQVPFEAVGKTLEDIGGKVIAVSDEAAAYAEKFGIDKLAKAAGAVGGAITGAIAGGPVGAVAGGLAGVSASPALAKVSLAGPMIKQLGTFTRTLGREAMEARGSVPYWQRVAENTELNPLTRATAHLADMATLGGRTAIPFRAAGRAALGTAAAAPMNLAFEFVSGGGDMSPEDMRKALASAMIFGGGPAAMGGLIQGTLRAKNQKELGNEINFRSELAPDQGEFFRVMPKAAQRAISETAAAFPALQWKFTDGVNSHYDPRANTIVVGTNTNRLLSAVVAHEVSHMISTKGQMEAGITAALVGHGETGGLLRSPDGTLDPDFHEFMDSYNKSAEAQGIQPLTVEQAAVEYFTDSTVQDVLSMVDSGELQKMAGRSQARRIVSDLSRLVVSRTPLIKDLAFKIGGAFDKGGKMVQGTGLLSAGIRELPGAKGMLRKFLREQAGRMGDGKLALKDEGAQIPLELAKRSKPLLDSMVSDFQTDAAGNVLYDAAGIPRYITKETAIRRASAGRIIAESMGKRIAEGETPPLGQIRPVGEDNWKGEWLPEYAIKELADSGHYNARQIANLRMVNSAAKRGNGELFFMVYNPALVKRHGKAAAYGSLGATFRDVVPLGMEITKAGQILVHLLSVTQFDKNLQKRAASATGKRLYQGDLNRIKADAYAMMEAHKTKGESKPYFMETYGPKHGEEYLNFINTVFDLNTPEQRLKNPLFDADKIPKYKDGVYKTYRLDRINQVTRLQGVPMPFSHDKMRDRLLPASFRLNLAPNGLPEPVTSPPPRPFAMIPSAIGNTEAMSRFLPPRGSESQRYAAPSPAVPVLSR